MKTANDKSQKHNSFCNNVLKKASVLEVKADNLRQSIADLADDMSFSDEENVFDEDDTKLIVNKGIDSATFGGINKTSHDFV